MAEQARANETLDLLARLRGVLANVEIDCDCRELLNSAMDRFAALENRRIARSFLSRARDHKERIAAILALLAELNQISESESDTTVFEEMALLFEEISRSAEIGASALRCIGPAETARLPPDSPSEVVPINAQR